MGFDANSSTAPLLKSNTAVAIVYSPLSPPCCQTGHEVFVVVSPSICLTSARLVGMGYVFKALMRAVLHVSFVAFPKSTK